MSKENIKTYSVEELQKLGPGKTNWDKIDKLTDEDIEKAMRDDPDWADLVDMDWSDAVVVVPRRKQAISIRLDADILDYFRSQGRGYQTHINAVLRSYIDQKKKERA